MKLRRFFHKWTMIEDITVAVYAINRKTDKKSIAKLSFLLGLSEGQISFRMVDYIKLLQGKTARWHIGSQEKKVFDWLTHNTGLTIKPI